MVARAGGGGGRPAIAPGLAFALPALTAIAVFFALPLAAALGLSFTDFDIYALASLRKLRFVGLRSYAQLLGDDRFWIALRNTLYFVLVGGPLSIAVSLAAALAIEQRSVRGKAILRTIFFLPVVTTLVAVAVVWRSIYHPTAGLLNRVLAALGLPVVDWLGDPLWAMPAIILLAVWKNFGFNMVIFIAGLQSIPERLYEAARIDGAGFARRFLYITWPMLRSTLGFVTTITLVGYFQLFAEPYVMTQGGPADSTLSIVLLMYEQGFRWWSLGSAAAVAFVLFLIILVPTVVQRRLAGGAA